MLVFVPPFLAQPAAKQAVVVRVQGDQKIAPRPSSLGVPRPAIERDRPSESAEKDLQQLRHEHGASLASFAGGLLASDRGAEDVPRGVGLSECQKILREVQRQVIQGLCIRW